MLASTRFTKCAITTLITLALCHPIATPSVYEHHAHLYYDVVDDAAINSYFETKQTQDPNATITYTKNHDMIYIQNHDTKIQRQNRANRFIQSRNCNGAIAFDMHCTTDSSWHAHTELLLLMCMWVLFFCPFMHYIDQNCTRWIHAIQWRSEYAYNRARNLIAFKFAKARIRTEIRYAFMWQDLEELFNYLLLLVFPKKIATLIIKFEIIFFF